MNDYIILSSEAMKTDLAYVFSDPKICSVFIYLLAYANTKAHKVGKDRIRRGAIATTNEIISNNCGVTIQSARTALATLERLGEIKREQRNRYQIITITNYERFKDDI